MLLFWLLVPSLSVCYEVGWEELFGGVFVLVCGWLLGGVCGGGVGVVCLLVLAVGRCWCGGLCGFGCEVLVGFFWGGFWVFLFWFGVV